MVTGLSRTEYTSARANYDLRRLRPKGLIQRVPHSNAYRITEEGLRFAVFYINVHDRVLTLLLAARPTPDTTRIPPSPALDTLARHTEATGSLTRDDEKGPAKTSYGSRSRRGKRALSCVNWLSLTRSAKAA